MSPLRYRESSATNDKAFNEVSGPTIETQTKSTNDRESPGPIVSPLGYSESSTNGE